MKKNYFKSLLKNNNIGLMIPNLIILVILITFSENFLSPFSLYNLGRTLGLYILIGLAQALTLVVGNMNLSIGAIGGFSAIITGYLLEVHHCHGLVAVIAGLTVGVIAGVISGIMVAKFGINSFIATLGILFIYTGLTFGITKGFPFYNIPESFLFMGQEKFLGIPVLLYFSILVLIVVFIFFKYSLAGKRMLASGENPVVAKFSGINVDKVIILAHVLSGIVAAIAGILFVTIMGAANPEIGQKWLVISFAIAIIGGTGLSGGTIAALGLFLGGVLIILIENAMVSFRANMYWEQAFFGMIIIISIFLEKIKMFINKRSLIK